MGVYYTKSLYWGGVFLTNVEERIKMGVLTLIAWELYSYMIPSIHLLSLPGMDLSTG